MEGLILLERARAAGLVVAREGEELVLTGPPSAEPIAGALVEAKPQVFLALRVVHALGMHGTWREASLLVCRQGLVAAGEHIRRFAESRWGQEARDWSPEMLAGFYARDLLGGLRAVLGDWRGWDAVRARLDHQTGPTVITRLWTAYAQLPEELRSAVIERGDRSQSPPACLAGGGHA